MSARKCTTTHAQYQPNPCPACGAALTELSDAAGNPAFACVPCGEQFPPSEFPRVEAAVRLARFAHAMFGFVAVPGEGE